MKSRLCRCLFMAFLALPAVMTGCGSETQPASSPSDSAPRAAGKAQGGRLFGVSVQTMNNPFFIDLETGLKEVIEAHGDRLVMLDGQFNSLKQKNDISDILQQEPAGLFINPVNWEGIRGSLVEAKRKNVPVLIVDSPVSDPDLVLSQVASDNVEAGRLAGEALARLNPNAKAVVLHLAINKACIDRVEGFKQAVANHPGMTILDTQEGKGTTEGGMAIMRDLLGRFSDLDAVFPINDPSALGAISAIESAGKLGKIIVTTVDGSREGIAAIQAGKLHASSAQFPRQMGKVAAETFYDHLSGKQVPRDVKIPVKLITKENAEEFVKSL